MTLTIHLARRRDLLVRDLGAFIGRVELGVFDSELVLVPGRALGQWADRMLAHEIPSRGGPVGISAGIEFRTQGALGEAFLIDGEAWSPQFLAWEILNCVAENADAEWARPLRAYLGDADAGPDARRYAGARRIAELFTRYSRERPELLRAWARGEETDSFVALPPNRLWQPHLYRALVAVVGQEPPSLHSSAAVAAATHAGVERFHVFGYSRLAAAELEFLREAADTFEIHLWISTPCTSMFIEMFRKFCGKKPLARSDFDEGLLHGLSRLTAATAEFAAVLGAAIPTASVEVIDSDRFSPSLLGRVQDGLAGGAAETWGAGSESGEHVAGADEPAGGDQPTAGDTSIQVHSCHGPSRQVEVLREALTQAFEDDPGLEPRDVLILCPDVEEYAPLVSAAFNTARDHPGGNLWVHAVDRPRAAVNPLLDLASELLGMVGGRVRSTDIVELLHHGAVQERFGFTEADLEAITAWITESGIRWGFDAEHRETFGVPTAQNTIEAGVQRLLVGAALGDEPFQGVLGAAAISSTEVELLGDFAEFLSRLRIGVSELAGARTAAEWSSGLGALIDALAVGEVGHHSELVRGLAQIARAAGARVTRADINVLLQELSEPRGGAVFLNGGMTLAPLTGTNIVPHKIVCLIGMDDDAFPRRISPDGDDALTQVPAVGEYLAREEDNRAFIDAIGSAQQAVIITYSGRHEENGTELPPAPPLALFLGELQSRGSANLVIDHPLHPFDPKYFDGSGMVSFDARSAQAARARRSLVPEPRLLDAPLREQPKAEITLTQLRSFFADPVKYFISEIVGANLNRNEEEVAEEIPLDLNALEMWAIGEHFVTGSAKNGWAPPDIDEQLIQGTLPPGELGVHVGGEIAEIAQAIVAHIAPLAPGPAQTLEISTKDRTLRGTVPQVYGTTIVSASYSAVGPKQRFAAWLNLLAVAATYPDENWTAIVVGRKQKQAESVHLRAPAAAESRMILAELRDLYDRGQREPIPLVNAASEAWARVVHENGGALNHEVRNMAIEAARKGWESAGGPRPAERLDPYQQAAWGGEISFHELYAIPAPENERWFDEPSRFGVLALRAWGRLLEHEF